MRRRFTPPCTTSRGHTTAQVKVLPGIGAWGGVRLRVAQFLANLWQGARRGRLYHDGAVIVPAGLDTSDWHVGLLSRSQAQSRPSAGRMAPLQLEEVVDELANLWLWAMTPTEASTTRAASTGPEQGASTMANQTLIGRRPTNGYALRGRRAGRRPGAGAVRNQGGQPCAPGWDRLVSAGRGGGDPTAAADWELEPSHGSAATATFASPVTVAVRWTGCGPTVCRPS
jgi:hypothetical protein